MKMIIYTYLILFVFSYRQFDLVRTPVSSKSDKLEQTTCNNLQGQYQQICYHKDISYGIRLYTDKQEYILAADLTTPISWIKSTQCYVHQTNKRCERLQRSFKDKIKEIGSHLVPKFKRNKIEQKQLTQISGSSNILKGQLVKCNNLQFQSFDSGRFSRVIDIILMGFYIIGEKDHLYLNETNFINATLISKNLNVLSDGSISMRFDQNSQKSFLIEIMKGLQVEKNIISIYLGQKNIISIGQLAIRYTKEGLSGVSWANLSKQKHYGRLPSIQSISIQGQSDIKISQINVDSKVVFTLSASYIAFPEAILKNIFQLLDKFATCTYNINTNLTQCIAKAKQFLNKQIIIRFQQNGFGLNLQQLLIQSKNKKHILNIKRSINEYTIIGQPFFKKYVLFMDYQNNKIGFALNQLGLNDSSFKSFIDLLRGFIFFFMIAICLICLHKPCKQLSIFLTKYPLAPNKSLKKIGKNYRPLDIKDQFDQENNTQSI